MYSILDAHFLSIVIIFDSEANIESIKTTDQKEVDWLRIVPLLFMHLMCLGVFWWELDMTYFLLVSMSWLGIVTDLRTVPEHMLHRNRVVTDKSTVRP